MIQLPVINESPFDLPSYATVSSAGLAAKHGITVLNTPGTIDADYRGEIGVILVNLSNEVVEISPGERIAQLVVAQYTQVDWQPVEALDSTARGAGGFGSTGKK